MLGFPSPPSSRVGQMTLMDDPLFPFLPPRSGCAHRKISSIIRRHDLDISFRVFVYKNHQISTDTRLRRLSITFNYLPSRLELQTPAQFNRTSTNILYVLFRIFMISRYYGFYEHSSRYVLIRWQVLSWRIHTDTYTQSHPSLHSECHGESDKCWNSQGASCRNPN